MNKDMHSQGPAVGAQQLVDIYRAGEERPSPWAVISDQVMGGISTATLQQCERNGVRCTCLTGRTRLDNNGGFVQMKLDIEADCAQYRGLFIELCGAAHEYNLHVKTSQLDRPWQSFRCALHVSEQWTRFIVPFEQLRAHRTDSEFAPAAIKSIAVVAIGGAFEVDVCVRRFGFFL